MDLSKFNVELNNDLVWRLFLTLCAISTVLLVSDTAFAAAAATSTNDVIGSTLCRLVGNLSGGISRAIATMAIFSVGIGLFLGKVNWSVAALTAAGVGIIFSAPKLVAFLSGSDADSNCSGT